MKILNKENLQKKITVHLDRKCYFEFLKRVAEIGKELEYKSNIKNLKYSVILNSVKVPYMSCAGITSRVTDSDGRITHAGFFDWDNVLETNLIDEVRYLSKIINCPIIILKTSEDKDCNGETYGNYMGIALVKKPLFDWININKSLTTDVNHSIVSGSYRYKCYVLRMSSKNAIKGKPTFKMIIDNSQTNFPDEISNAHKEFLEGLYPEIKAGLSKYKFKLDEHTAPDLVLAEYKTGSG